MRRYSEKPIPQISHEGRDLHYKKYSEHNHHVFEELEVQN
jgi:hypothetical protein